MINKVVKISELPLLQQLLANAQTIVANKELKTNNTIKLSQIKGSNIDNIESIDYTDEDGKKYIIINFIYNGEVHTIIAKHGDDGAQGEPGIQGDKGPSGASFINNMIDTLGENKVLIISNENNVDDPNSLSLWSAYRGKEMQSFIDSIREIFMSDAEYQLRFNEQIFIDLEFTTQTDNQDSLIVYNDNVDHKTYVKYWTYEDEDNNAEYYIMDQDGNYILAIKDIIYFIWDNESETYIEVNKQLYDEDLNQINHKYQQTVPFDIWNDYYLNADNNNDYYTRKLVTTVINEITQETTTNYVYTKVDKPTWLDLEFTTNTEDVNSVIIYAITDDGDDNYVKPENKDDSVVIIHIPITSITIDGKTQVDIEMNINSILTKNILINNGNDYQNSPIGIEYDDSCIKVFEDGRIMAIKNNCETTVRIYSVENPSIQAIINLNIVTKVTNIVFENITNGTINVYMNENDDENYYKLSPKIYPIEATNVKIKYSTSELDYNQVDIDDINLEKDYYIKLEDNTLQKVNISETEDNYINITYNNILVYSDNQEYDLSELYNNIDTAVYNNCLKYIINDNNEIIQLVPIIYTENTDKVVELVEIDNETYIHFLNEGSASVYAQSTDGSNIVTVLYVNVQTASTNIIINDNNSLYDYTYEEQKIENGQPVYDDENNPVMETITINNCYDFLYGVQTTIRASVEPSTASNKKLIWSIVGDSSDIFLRSNIDGSECEISSYKDFTIKVSSEDGYAEQIINMRGKTPIREIVLNTTAITLDTDETFDLAVLRINSDSDFNLNHIIFESDNETIATVNRITGLITAKTSGQVLIRAKAIDGSGVEATCLVTSVQLITSITFNNIENNIMNIFVDNTYEINYTITPTTAYNKELIWYCSDDSVVEVHQGINNTGIMIGKSEGHVTIYAMANDNSGIITSLNVNVAVPSSELLLSNYELNLNVNDEYTLIATVVPDNTTNQNLLFSSSDNSVVSVDNNGHLIAIKAGQSTITITTTDINNILSQQCVVNVN